MVPDPPDGRATTLDDLLDRVGAGDAGALDELLGHRLAELSQWVSAQLPRSARDLADTTAIVQETLLASFARPGRLARLGEGAFGAYIRTAVLNRVRDEVRRVRRGSANALDLRDRL